MSTSPTVPKIRILVGICSCLAHKPRRDAVRATWLTQPTEGVQSVFFVGGKNPLPDEPETIALDAPDFYDYLPAKVKAFFTYAIANYDFEWLFKCDDDTYVATDRLRELAAEGPDMAGNDHFIKTHGYASGGAGYLLSRRYVERLVNDGSLPRTGPEDRIITKAAIKYGAKPLATNRLCWRASPFPRPDNTLITAHWCSPDKLRAIHTVFSESPTHVYFAIHKQWSDHMKLYPNGYFYRASSGCCGRWERSDESRNLRLSWFDWKEEVLPAKGNGYKSENLALTPVRIRSASQAPIPQVIHALWLGSDTPAWVKQNLRTWARCHPDWNVILWDESLRRAAEASLTPEEAVVYSQLPAGVLQTTVLRFSLLRQNGGLYVDVDFPCLRPFLHLIPDETTFGYGQKRNGDAECALLLARRGDPFLTWQIEQSLEFWLSLSPQAQKTPTRDRVIWPFNDFCNRVPKYFPVRSNGVRQLDEYHEGWGTLFPSGLLSIWSPRLHGGIGAFAHHRYSHTWWPKKGSTKTTEP